MLKRWLAPFREFGWAAGAAYVGDRVLQRLTQRAAVRLYDLMEQPVDSSSPLPAAHAQHVRWQRLGPGSPELELMPVPASVRQARLAQGAHGLAVYLRDKYVGYAWLAFDHHDEDEVRCRFGLEQPQRSAFDFDVYVFPQYRLGRAFAAVWHAVNAYLRERGVERTCSRISRFNVASQRAHAQLGARRVGSALFLQFGALQLAFGGCGHSSPMHVGISSRWLVTI